MAFIKQKLSHKEPGKCVLLADGDMSIYAAEQNHAELNRFYPDFEDFELDLSAVEEIDSSGIQLLVALQQSVMKDGKKMSLISVSQPVDEVMEILNIKDQFNWVQKA
jgi:anti-sigma B factor antagonist